MENASDDFPQRKKLENLLPNFAGSSPPISPKTSPTSIWKSLTLAGILPTSWLFVGVGILWPQPSPHNRLSAVYLQN